MTLKPCKKLRQRLFFFLSRGVKGLVWRTPTPVQARADGKCIEGRRERKGFSNAAAQCHVCQPGRTLGKDLVRIERGRMRVLSLWAGLACVAGVAQGQFDAGNMPSPEEAFKKLRPLLDKPLPTEQIPKDAAKYIKQGDPFYKMLARKFKTDACKENFDWFWEKAKAVISKEEKNLTPRVIFDQFCEVGADCVSELLEVVTDFTKGNALVDKLLKAGLKKGLPDLDLKLDDIVSNAPMAYMAGCMAYDSAKGEADEGAAIEDGKDEL